MTSFLRHPFLDFSKIQITHASATCIFTAAHRGSRVLVFSFPRFLLFLSVRYLHALFLPFMCSNTHAQILALTSRLMTPVMSHCRYSCHTHTQPRCSHTFVLSRFSTIFTPAEIPRFSDFVISPNFQVHVACM